MAIPVQVADRVDGVVTEWLDDVEAVAIRSALKFMALHPDRFEGVDPVSHAIGEAKLLAGAERVLALLAETRHGLQFVAARVRPDAPEDEDDGELFVVLSPDGDVEVLDKQPRWDWEALGQVVRVANVNGGDSAAVPMPAENRGR